MTEFEITQKVRALKKERGRRQSFFNFQLSKTGQLAVVYLVAITLAEILTNLIAPQLGLVLHGMLLLALLLQGALIDSVLTRRFLLALSLAPLTRLLSLALPLQHFPLVYWYLLVGTPLALAAVFSARTGHVSRAYLGLTVGKLPLQALVSLTGIGLGYLEYYILRPEPLITELRLELIWLPALILLVFTGFLEEFIFRGLMQSAATRSLGRAGLAYSAVIFAVLHLGYRSWLDLAFVFVVALYFGWVVQFSGSILGVTIAHGLTNISLFLVFPFLLGPVVPATGTSILEPYAPIIQNQSQAIPTSLPIRPTMTPFQPMTTPTSTNKIPTQTLEQILETERFTPGAGSTRMKIPP